MDNNTDRLNKIDAKLNILIAMLEGKHGAEGLATQIYRNREDIKVLKRLIYKVSGGLVILIPLLSYIIRQFISL